MSSVAFNLTADGCPARDPRFPPTWPAHQVPVNAALFAVFTTYAVLGLACFFYFHDEPFLLKRGKVGQSMLFVGLFFQLVVSVLREAVGRDTFSCDVYLWFTCFILPICAAPTIVRLVVFGSRSRFAENQAKVTMEALRENTKQQQLAHQASRQHMGASGHHLAGVRAASTGTGGNANAPANPQRESSSGNSPVRISVKDMRASRGAGGQTSTSGVFAFAMRQHAVRGSGESAGGGGGLKPVEIDANEAVPRGGGGAGAGPNTMDKRLAFAAQQSTALAETSRRVLVAANPVAYAAASVRVGLNELMRSRGPVSTGRTTMATSADGGDAAERGHAGSKRDSNLVPPTPGSTMSRGSFTWGGSQFGDENLTLELFLATKLLSSDGFAIMLTILCCTPFLIVIGWRYGTASFYGRGCVGCQLYSVEAEIFAGAAVCIVLFVAWLSWALRRLPDPLLVRAEIQASVAVAAVFTVIGLILNASTGPAADLYYSGTLTWAYFPLLGLLLAYTIQVVWPVYVALKRKYASRSVHTQDGTLAATLADAHMRSQLVKFLIQEWAVESFRFLEQVDKFKRACEAGATEDERQDLAEQIYETFIRPDSPLEVNISSVQREPYRMLFSFPRDEREVDANTFDVPYQEVFSLLSRDSHVRFLNWYYEKYPQRKKVGNRTSALSSNSLAAKSPSTLNAASLAGGAPAPAPAGTPVGGTTTSSL